MHLSGDWSDQLKTACTLFKMSWLRQRLAAPFDPIRDPSHHLLLRNAWFAEDLKRLFSVAEQRVGRLHSVEVHRLAEAHAKIFG